MSLACILSGNLNCAGSCGNFKLLWFQAGRTFGNVAAVKKCRFQRVTTQVIGSSQDKNGNKSSSMNLNLLDGNKNSSATLNSENVMAQELRRAQSYGPEHTTDRKKTFEWPAVVIVFDIETTGLSRKERIIEIAFKDLLGGRNSTFQTLVNPDKVVRNADVHGINTDMVNRPGVPRMRDLIPIILKYVESRQILGKPVLFVAHNGRRFDIPFFIREFNRCSAEVPSDWLFVDTLPLARKLVKPDGSKLPSSSLQALREHYQIPLVGQCHRAMQDVVVLSKVLQKMTFELELSVTDLISASFKASDISKGSLGDDSAT